MCPDNEGRRYNVTSSRIGGTQKQNDPCPNSIVAIMSGESPSVCDPRSPIIVHGIFTSEMTLLVFQLFPWLLWSRQTLHTSTQCYPFFYWLACWIVKLLPTHWSGSNGLWDSFGFVPCINCHHHHVYLRVTHFGLNQTAKHGWLKQPAVWILKGYWLVEAKWHIYVLVN